MNNAAHAFSLRKRLSNTELRRHAPISRTLHFGVKICVFDCSATDLEENSQSPADSGGSFESFRSNPKLSSVHETDPETMQLLCTNLACKNLC